MNCLKCGRETDQTFCEICRAEMEKHPVKPGVVVVLPKERKPIVRRQPVRNANANLERRIAAQNRILHHLAVTVVVLVILLILTGVVSFYLIRSNSGKPLGQNYSTVTASSQTQTEATNPENVPAQIDILEE